MCLAVPGQVCARREADDGQIIGEVSYNGLRKPVNLSFVPEATLNDYVIVHAGFAIAVLDQEEAELTLQTVQQYQQDSADEIHR